MSTQPQEPFQEIAYASFYGILDMAGTSRVMAGLSGATQKGVKHVHLLWQSDGGGVGNGVSLYNLFRNLPFGLTVYNTGTVSSAALLAYLGAKHRKTSANATFLIHRTTDTLEGGREAQFRDIAERCAINDELSESLLRDNITLTDPQWDKLNRLGNLFLTAQEAIGCWIADEIADFSPPPGTIFYAL